MAEAERHHLTPHAADGAAAIKRAAADAARYTASGDSLNLVGCTS
jgi:hypothetical protein